jgi:hypothetical protein
MGAFVEVSLLAPACLAVLFLAAPQAVPTASPAPSPTAAPDSPSTGAMDDGPASDPQRNNTLRWVVTGGSTNYAYEVFRAESEAGPFVKINRRFISGHINKRSDAVPAYHYVDDDIDLTKDYWYYVEAINLMGQRSRLTPVTKAPAKTKTAGASAQATPTAH